jgi:hypothetical protein
MEIINQEVAAEESQAAPVVEEGSEAVAPEAQEEVAS